MARRQSWILAFALLLAMRSGLPCAQTVADVAVKAAFVFNFGKFVERPASAAEQQRKFGLCYAGALGALYKELGRLEDKTIHDKPVVVIRITSAGELANCSMLVIGDTDVRPHVRELVKAAEARSVLTVGDGEGFAAAGTVFGFVSSGDRVGFEVNLDSARAANLRVPSQLARLGKLVSTAR